MHGPQDPTGEPTPAAPTGWRRLVGALPGPARLALLVAALLAAFIGSALLIPRSATTPAAAQRPADRPAVTAPAPAVPGGTARAPGTAVLRARETPPTPRPTRASARPGRQPKKPAPRPAQPSPGRAAADAAAAPDKVTRLENQVTTLVNNERDKAGCGAVRTDGRLRTAARAHSLDMARNDYFSHDGLNGSSPWDRAEAAGYPNPIGENIAKGQPGAADVMDAWMNSDGHRRNILNCSAKEIGVGLAYDGDTPVWTQLFGAG